MLKLKVRKDLDAVILFRRRDNAYLGAVIVGDTTTVGLRFPAEVGVIRKALTQWADMPVEELDAIPWGERVVTRGESDPVCVQGERP